MKTAKEARKPRNLCSWPDIPLDVWRDGELSWIAAVRVVWHVRRCPHCAVQNESDRHFDIRIAAIAPLGAEPRRPRTIPLAARAAVAVSLTALCIPLCVLAVRSILPNHQPAGADATLSVATNVNRTIEPSPDATAKSHDPVLMRMPPVLATPIAALPRRLAPGGHAPRVASASPAPTVVWRRRTAARAPRPQIAIVTLSAPSPDESPTPSPDTIVVAVGSSPHQRSSQQIIVTPVTESAAPETSAPESPR